MLCISFLVGLVLLASINLNTCSSTFEYPNASHLLYEECIFADPENIWDNTRKIYEQEYCLPVSSLDKHPLQLWNKNYHCMAGSPLTGLESRSRHCSTRSIPERHSLWRTKHGRHDARNLVETLISNNFTQISSLGDSVTAQLDTMLLCDVIRDGDTSVLEPKEFNDLIHKRQVRFQSHSKSSTESAMEHLVEFRYVSYYREPYGRKVQRAPNLHDALLEGTSRDENCAGNSIIVFNHGLHCLNYVFIRPMATQLLAYAKENPKDLIFFRETSAQHFSYSPNGVFDSNLRASGSTGMQCCSVHNITQHSIEGDNHFIREFTALDPNWRDFIGWIPFFNLSASLHDIHIEWGDRGQDCTHFIYAPHVFESVWRDLRSEVKRLLEVRGR